MALCTSEPILSVGLLENASGISFELHGCYRLNNKALEPGGFEARFQDGSIVLTSGTGQKTALFETCTISPENIDQCSFTLHNIAIGRDFHWERFRDQRFRGNLVLLQDAPGSLTVINKIPLEHYLQSVICSEMNPESPAEFLKAHCVISRSWLLAQLKNKKESGGNAGTAFTDASAHALFDVCADDHCQRYHGLAAVNPAADEALRATRGLVLTSEGTVCDTRFSKCCGGITELFSTAWQDRDYSYLRAVADSQHDSAVTNPATTDAAARDFILSRPDVFCNVSDPELLGRILPDFDGETRDFFRWETTLSRTALSELVHEKSGIDFGLITELQPLKRGPSGRIYALRISGEKETRVVGKELEIRRLLSPSHLYSSCFIVKEQKDFVTLKGAGWGHGVGLCQIGAAAMAFQGYSHQEILTHYFRGANLQTLY